MSKSSSSAPSDAPPSPAAGSTFQTGQKIGHSNQFRIVGLLGRGGFGEVYLAREDRAERHVAIKVILPKFNSDKKMLRRFKGEYILGTRLSHPGLVQMYDLAETPEGIHYIVMEYLQGENLHTRMDKAEKSEGQLGVESALHLAWQISSLFAQLHERRIIHRDLKPGNIMVVPDPTIHGGERHKLLDFGIAKLTDADRARNLDIDIQTSAGVQLGTVPLMSPESFRQGQAQGPETDVYALGCMLYRCIAGNYPFTSEANSDIEVATRHLYDDPIPLTSEDPSVPQDVADIIHRMLDKERVKRPSMQEISVFFARKLGIASAGGVQIVVRGGTKELQAVIGDITTGGATPATLSGPVQAVASNPPSTQVGQQVSAPQTKQLRRGRQLMLGGVVAAGALLTSALLVRSSLSSSAGRGGPSSAALPAVVSVTQAQPDMARPQGAAVTAPAPAQPVTASSTPAPEDKPATSEKKRKKGKHVGLFSDTRETPSK